MYSRRIIELRLKRNWTQTQLAQNSNIPQPMVARYENGTTPSTKNVKKLADAFGIPVEEFLIVNAPKSQTNLSLQSFDLSKAWNDIKRLSNEDKMRIKDYINLLVQKHEEGDKLKAFERIINGKH
jgi:transcriptional regulator with XRE-family HTH domain